MHVKVTLINKFRITYFSQIAPVLTNCIIFPHNNAPNVPTPYPKTASNTPTGANAGEKAEATIGAESCATNIGLRDPTSSEEKRCFNYFTNSK